MTLLRIKLRRLKNTGCHKSISGLYGQAPGRHHNLARLWHNLTHPRRCLVHFSLKRTKLAYDDFRGNMVVVHTTARIIEITHFARSNI
jgi:hypothetical protein